LGVMRKLRVRMPGVPKPPEAGGRRRLVLGGRSAGAVHVPDVLLSSPAHAVLALLGEAIRPRYMPWGLALVVLPSGSAPNAAHLAYSRGWRYCAYE
jgi:hypothetical protein